jgi:hypothetical protein
LSSASRAKCAEFGKERDYNRNFPNLSSTSAFLHPAQGAFGRIYNALQQAALGELQHVPPGNQNWFSTLTSTSCSAAFGLSVR